MSGPFNHLFEGLQQENVNQTVDKLNAICDSKAKADAVIARVIGNDLSREEIVTITNLSSTLVQGGDSDFQQALARRVVADVLSPSTSPTVRSRLGVFASCLFKASLLIGRPKDVFCVNASVTPIPPPEIEAVIELIDESVREELSPKAGALGSPHKRPTAIDTADGAPNTNEQALASTIYFTKLDSTVSDAAFRLFLDTQGDVLRVRLCGERGPGKTMFGFVEFSCPDEAEKLLAMTNPVQIPPHGNTMVVERARKPIQFSEPADAVIDARTGHKIRPCAFGSPMSQSLTLTDSGGSFRSSPTPSPKALGGTPKAFSSLQKRSKQQKDGPPTPHSYSSGTWR